MADINLENEKSFLDAERDEHFIEDYGQIDELRTSLGQHYVYFTFYKKDGSLRKAIGTRSSKKLEEVDAPIPFGNPPASLPFYDLEDQHWKSISLKRANRPRVVIVDSYDTIEEMLDLIGDEFLLDHLADFNEEA